MKYDRLDGSLTNRGEKKMMRRTIQSFAFVSMALIFMGCSSHSHSTAQKSLEVQTYVVDKERVDQDLQAGNSGYLQGTPKPADRGALKATRKVYVLEVTKNPRDAQEAEVTAAAPSSQGAFDSWRTQNRQTEDTSSQAQPIPIAIVDEEAPSTTPKQTTIVEYTVKDNDTLQKISKEFYGSNKKWSRIYDDNKDAIKNPDRIKPGTVLKISVEK